MKIENTPISKIHEYYIAQRNYFDAGKTLDIEFRRQQLEKLKAEIAKREEEILKALEKDMGKPRFESYGGEIGLVYREIEFMLKNLDKLAREERRKTPFILKPSTSSVIYEPKGVVLIISPWNYPFQLVITPLVGAMAAGNTAILKPSEVSYHTSRLIEDIVVSCFSEEYISVIQGEGHAVIPELMENHRLDHVLFTGSNEVGKEIAKMAAPHLTPVTLELGGKTPAIIDESANLKQAAKKVVWAKYFNAGQTCIAPDFAIVHESVRDEFLEHVKKYIKQFYGDRPEESKNYTRLINIDHLRSVAELLKGQEIYYGGNMDVENKFIEPTIIFPRSWEDSIMKEEIFGPILPILNWSNRDELLKDLRKNRYPLSCYVFTKSKSFESFILQNFQFGSSCINDTMVHLASEHLPFGGVGYSGYGRYRGWESIKLFSNEKSLLRSSSWFDPPVRYPNYSNSKLLFIKRLLSW